MAIVDWYAAQLLANQIALAGTVIGALGLLGIAWQLAQQAMHAQTAFEDTFDERYRQVVSRIPTKAMLGEALTDEEYSGAFDELYHYVDLCNEQVFLWKRRRVRRKTWLYWVDGIKGNFARPAFQRAWIEISSKAPADFSELRAALTDA